MGNVADRVHFERIVPLFGIRCKTRIAVRLARLENFIYLEAGSVHFGRGNIARMSRQKLAAKGRTGQRLAEKDRRPC